MQEPARDTSANADSGLAPRLKQMRGTCDGRVSDPRNDELKSQMRLSMLSRCAGTKERSRHRQHHRSLPRDRKGFRAPVPHPPGRGQLILCHKNTFVPGGVVRGWYIAMEQDSSLCEGAAIVSLDAVDTGDEVLGRVQAECGREEVNDGEKQERDKHEETDNERSNTHRGWHEDGMTRTYRHVGWLVLSHAV